MTAGPGARDSPAVELPPREGDYRLGVFGSMMNPPHLGHHALVAAVHEQLHLHRVMVVPSGIPPHRRAPKVSARARLTMAVRAFADLDHVVVSDSEVDRGESGEVGYMVDTVEEALEIPELLGYHDLTVEVSLVVGADQVAHLTTWHRWDELAKRVRVAVIGRPDQQSAADVTAQVEHLRRAGVAIDVVDMAPVAVSSTMVREAAQRADRAAVAAMVPAAIVGDVMHLYGPDAL
ncbi:MAG: nadD [Thermoleophilia bacterium]|nr:nadD [Thermoleophilia bacterium]